MVILHTSLIMKHVQGVPKKIVDSELFTPGDDNNTQQKYCTSGLEL